MTVIFLALLVKTLSWPFSSRLLPLVALGFSVLVFCSCSSTRTESIAAISTESTAPSSIQALENQCFYHVNGYREGVGLVELKPHPGLTKLARKHSQDMLKRGKIGHFDFASRAAVAQRKYDMHGVAENLQTSWGFSPTGSYIVREWINSPPHKKNMDGTYNHAGVGIARVGDRIYTTLLLGRGIGDGISPQGPTSPYLVY